MFDSQKQAVRLKKNKLHHDKNHNIRYLTIYKGALGSNVEIKRLTHFAASVRRSYLVYDYHVSYLFSDGILDQSRSGLRCDPVIPLVQGKVHEQPPKHGSGTVKHGALTYFDLQTWIHLGSFFIFGIRLWGWLTCGDLVGDFLKFSDIIPSSQFMKVHGFIHLESSLIFGQMSRNFSNCCRWSRWTKAPPCYVPGGHRLKIRCFWLFLKATLETNRTI